MCGKVWFSTVSWLNDQSTETGTSTVCWSLQVLIRGVCGSGLSSAHPVLPTAWGEKVWNLFTHRSRCYWSDGLSSQEILPSSLILLMNSKSVVECVSHLFFCRLHAWTHSDDLLVASLVDHTGTHWEKKPLNVKLVTCVFLFEELCQKAERENKTFSPWHW